MEKTETRRLDTSGYYASTTQLYISISTSPSQAPTETTVIKFDRKKKAKRIR